MDPALWTGLQPTERINSDGTGLAGDRDNTAFTTNGAYTHSRPYWHSIDAVGGWVFGGYNLGLHIFDARGGKAAVPSKVTSIQIESLDVLFRQPHDFYIITDVDAVDDDSNLVVMTGLDGVGMVAIDTTSKSSPRVFYQDGGTASTKYGEGVYATRINNRYYGFMAAQDGTGAGLWFYDLTAGLSGNCSEARPASANCPGVFKTKLSNDPQSHVDGAGTDALGHWVVFSGGQGGATGLEVWNLSQPSSPVQTLTGFAGRRVDGVAMWEQAGKFYLAAGLVRNASNPTDEARIYDVSCLRTGCLTNPLNGSPVYSFPILGPGKTTFAHSISGGQHYLHIGRAYAPANRELQAEWLLNVTNPTTPFDLAGGDPRNGNLGQPTISVGGTQVGYWNWYSACNASGSNFFEPADGIVSDGYLYRAGSSILDVHEITEANPTLLVTVNPATTYTGTSVTAQASALNCTPDAGGWSWTASGGGSVTGSGSSVGISWTTTGTKTVSASNTGCPGATVSPVTVTVLQAAPAVGSVTSDVTAASVCSPVTFTANNVTGKPTLSHAWEIRTGAEPSALVGPLASNTQSAVWDTTGVTPGMSYKARYTVSNTSGSPAASKDSPLVTINPLDTLGFSAPIGATVAFGNVNFAANATGATEWKWDFGDGSPVLQTTDPVLGPAPSHTYTAVGTYYPTVEVRNCVETAWQTNTTPKNEQEEETGVVITEINPLAIVLFQAGGPFPNFYDAGEAVPFVTQVSGDPTTYDYDWDGNGTYEDAGRSSAAASHVYSTPGSYQPRLRISKGAAEKVLQHAVVIEISGNQAPPPSVSLSGPSTGKVDQSRSFTATASNCTPGTWSWTASGGGSISGSGSTVSIVWSTPGTKTVRATASGCSGLSASRTISITSDDTTGPTPLKAAFISAPQAPQVGQTVTFDASTSEGNPSDYTWDFGDGTTGSGKQTTHTYTQPGTRTVKLQVAKDDPACQFGVCTDEMTKTVVVEGGQVVPSTNGCSGDLADDPDKLCLLDERFVVEVAWRDQHNNNRTGVGTAAAYGTQGVTGFFWFFNPKKVELLVKILDARDPQTGEGNFWVFYGSLSDVHFELKVTDTETGDVKEYVNDEGSLCGKSDTAAFTVGPSEAGAGSAVLPFGTGGVGSVAQPIGAGDGGADSGLLLHDGRFRVTVDWTNQHNGGATGQGTPIPGTKESGYFWFFNQRNLELAVKIVDASALGEGFWIFWAGLSDVEYTLKVEDLETGKSWSRVNAPGNFCGGHDGDPVFD